MQTSDSPFKNSKVQEELAGKIADCTSDTGSNGDTTMNSDIGRKGGDGGNGGDAAATYSGEIISSIGHVTIVMKTTGGSGGSGGKGESKTAFIQTTSFKDSNDEETQSSRMG